MRTVHAQAVERTAEICGEQALADRLGVSRSRLSSWMRGTAEPPDSVFPQVVDILSECALNELKNLSPDSGALRCEILTRAAEVVGGEDKLAQHVDVGSEQMREWIRGKATASVGVYLIALDILSSSSARPNEEKAPKGVQSCGALSPSKDGSLGDNSY